MKGGLRPLGLPTFLEGSLGGGKAAELPAAPPIRMDTARGALPTPAPASEHRQPLSCGHACLSGHRQVSQPASLSQSLPVQVVSLEPRRLPGQASEAGRGKEPGGHGRQPLTAAGWGWSPGPRLTADGRRLPFSTAPRLLLTPRPRQTQQGV